MDYIPRGNSGIISTLKVVMAKKASSKSSKNSNCAEKVQNSFQAGLNIGRNMKKPIAKKK
jgi:hypothetical protein